MSLQMAPNSAIKSEGRAGLAGGAVTQAWASRGRQARLASVSLTAPAGLSRAFLRGSDYHGHRWALL